MKAAVAHFTTNLAVLEGRHGIRVNGIGPDLPRRRRSTTSPASRITTICGRRGRRSAGWAGRRIRPGSPCSWPRTSPASSPGTTSLSTEAPRPEAAGSSRRRPERFVNRPRRLLTRSTRPVDVLVVGSGGGVAGAYTAAREGLSVALVEATDQFGGTTAYSGGGGMWFPCNPVLVRAGCDDTIETALEYFDAVVGDRTPVELQEAYVRGGAAFIEYVERDERFAFKILPWPDYYGAVPGARAPTACGTSSRRPSPTNGSAGSVDWSRGPLDHERLTAPKPELLTGGRALVGRFLAAIIYSTGRLSLTNTRLVELVARRRSASSAEWSSTRAERQVVRTRRGVLLAAGGFEQNARHADRIRRLPAAASDTMGAPGSMGLAHRAGIAAGGEYRPDGPGVVGPGIDPSRWSGCLRAVVHRRGIFVDDDGTAFRQRVRPPTTGSVKAVIKANRLRRNLRLLILDDL